MRPCPEPPHRHPLSPWVARLPGLQNRLAAAGFRIGPDRWLNLQDLLFRFYQEGRLPQEVRALRKFVRPLFCRGPEDSKTFDACFEAWVTEGQKADLPAAEPVASPYAEPVTSQLSGFDRPPPNPFRRRFLAALAVSFLLIFLAVGCWLWGCWEESTEGPRPSQIDRPISPLRVSEPASETLRPREGLEPKPVSPPLRTLPEGPSLGPEDARRLDTLGRFLPWLGLPIALAWLVWVWSRRRYVLRRAEDSGREDPLESLSIHRDDQPLFATPSVREALHRLHRSIEVPGRALDVAATVAASIRGAGFFRPVRRSRRFIPELLVLVDTRGPQDLAEGLGRLVAERLRRYGHEVFVYTYQGAPSGFVDEDFQVVPDGVAGLAYRHPQARLLLIGDPQALLTNLGTHLIAEADALTRWPQRGLLSTRDPHPTWVGVLAAAGFHAEPLTEAGLRAIGVWLADLSQPTATQRHSPLPPVPFQDPHMPLWRRRPQSSRFKADLAALRGYLGPDGYLLLGAMAVYPVLHWGLTQVLDSRLFPDDTPERRERRLLRLAQLSWCRIGWLPEWFRIYLLRRLTRRERRTIRGEFRILLRLRATATDGAAIRLPFRVAERPPRHEGGWRDYLAGLIGQAPDHSRIKDAVFANLILGGRLGLWDFTLPRWIGRRLPGGQWPRFLGSLLKAFAGVLLFWLIATGLWQDQLRGLVEDWALARQIAANQGQPVAVITDGPDEALSEALQASLAQYGFKPVTLEPEVRKRLSQAPVADHVIRYGPDASDATRQAAREIAAQLAYLSYRSPATIDIRAMEDPDAIPGQTILVHLAGGSAAPRLPGEEKRIFGDPDGLIVTIDDTMTPESSSRFRAVPQDGDEARR
ncbi:hypothetical protein [Candidatus Thiosymbion oneisti]|uniref:hypothetical protein n=1 Tax=Candidatus Thiosymbion oneisti TaxID=589554 RepID=UPI000B7D222E|nr:hypothetical protein [Candidatus Thiosymbion oneisti]